MAHIWFPSEKQTKQEIEQRENLHRHWKLWRRAIKTPDGQQSWAKDVGWPFLPQKGSACAHTNTHTHTHIHTHTHTHTHARTYPHWKQAQWLPANGKTQRKDKSSGSAAPTGLAASPLAWNPFKGKVRRSKKNPLSLVLGAKLGLDSYSSFQDERAWRSAHPNSLSGLLTNWGTEGGKAGHTVRRKQGSDCCGSWNRWGNDGF